jgi:hypothetical protein
MSYKDIQETKDSKVKTTLFSKSLRIKATFNIQQHLHPPCLEDHLFWCLFSSKVMGKYFKGSPSYSCLPLLPSFLTVRAKYKIEIFLKCKLFTAKQHQDPIIISEAIKIIHSNNISWRNNHQPKWWIRINPNAILDHWEEAYILKFKPDMNFFT